MPCGARKPVKPADLKHFAAAVNRVAACSRAAVIADASAASARFDYDKAVVIDSCAAYAALFKLGAHCVVLIGVVYTRKPHKDSVNIRKRFAVFF